MHAHMSLSDFCRCERVCIGVFLCACVHWARGTDVRLTSAGCSPGCGLAGFQGVQLKTKEGGSTPSGCQAACLTVRWSELVCYRVSAAQTENSVSRQAGATGGHQPSGALERLSLKALRKCSVTPAMETHVCSYKALLVGSYCIIFDTQFLRPINYRHE